MSEVKDVEGQYIDLELALTDADSIAVQKKVAALTF
jgi:hypothetical protein